VIRQAISCDICGREMQNPNHWFVVYDRGPEFRMTRWNTRTRLRPEARHLCGQTCLHKLVDDFMARTISERTSTATADKADQPQPEKAQPEKEKQTQQSGIKPADASLAAAPPQTTPIRPAVPIPHTYPDTYIDDYESSARLITPIEPERKPNDAPLTSPSYSSRSWRADAWKREREREQREATHRRSIA
jgi:hypothetical protein